MTTKQAVNTKQKRIDEALDVLRQLGMPNEQLNDRTAICLLALLDLPENTSWNKADNPMLGIRAILDFAREKLEHNYAENTRESIRKYSVKQLVAAGVLLHNPDKPDRGEIMRKFLSVVAWKTEVWCASDPTHLIHFNGIRFLGPYAK